MKILILTWSAWSGHNSAAFALENYAKKQWYSTHIEDISYFCFRGRLQKFFHKIFSEKIPRVGRIIFAISNAKRLRSVRNLLNSPTLQEKFESLLEKEKPDHIILTQKSWIPLLTKHLKKNQKEFSVSLFICHYFYSIHSFWIMKPEYVDWYFVFDDESKKYLITEYDIPKEKICVSFFPFDEDIFTQRETIGHKDILVLATGLDIDFLMNIPKELTQEKWYQITFVWGRNTDNFKKVQQTYKNKAHISFHQTIDISKQLPKHDIFIGKPGWAILAECVASQTPLFIPNHFLWEEDANVSLVQKYELGIYETDRTKIDFLIRYLDRNKILPNFDNIRKKDSNKIIFDTITTN